MSKKQNPAKPGEIAAPLYKTIGPSGKSELTEKKSVFIGAAAHVETVEEAVEFVSKVRSGYTDARHNVYAYLVGMNTRYSDDGEPQGTAGLPVLDAIRKSGLTDAAVVVTRYFGGILLGTGGLVRAYSSCASMALADAGTVTRENCVCFTLGLSYTDYKKLEKELGSDSLMRDSVDFAEGVVIRAAIREGDYPAFRSRISEATAGRAAFADERIELRSC